jgi:hypothetical protein
MIKSTHRCSSPSARHHGASGNLTWRTSVRNTMGCVRISRRSDAFRRHSRTLGLAAASTTTAAGGEGAGRGSSPGVRRGLRPKEASEADVTSITMQFFY